MGLLDLPLDFLFSRIAAERPVVCKRGSVLLARSDWRSQLWCLGFGSNKVEVDPTLRIIRIIARRFWFSFQTRRIDFDRVEEIEYAYRDARGNLLPHQGRDIYTVGLRLKGGESVNLFRFEGEGDFMADGVLPAWMFWQESLVAPYLKGDQENESLMFADLLARMIGVPLGNPLP